MSYPETLLSPSTGYENSQLTLKTVGLQSLCVQGILFTYRTFSYCT